jgi:glutamyl-tRNA reductase
MAEDVRKTELEKTLPRMGPMEEGQIKAIERLTVSIVNKLVHPPTAALKSEEDNKELMLDIVQKLFKLDTEDNNDKS